MDHDLLDGWPWLPMVNPFNIWSWWLPWPSIPETARAQASRASHCRKFRSGKRREARFTNQDMNLYDRYAARCFLSPSMAGAAGQTSGVWVLPWHQLWGQQNCRLRRLHLQSQDGFTSGLKWPAIACRPRLGSPQSGEWLGNRSPKKLRSTCTTCTTAP